MLKTYVSVIAIGKAPEMFAKSANVYVRMAEEEVLGHSAYIQNFKAEDLESFKA